MLDIPTKTDDTTDLSAPEFNANENELENAVTVAGLALNEENTHQLGEAISMYCSGGGMFYQDSGSTNNFILTSPLTFRLPPAYFNGMEVQFVSGSTNDDACTLIANGIAVKDLKDFEGNALPANSIFGGDFVTAVFDIVSDEFRLISVSRNVLPTGLIIMWNDDVASIPDSWLHCDGTNGTPDLRNLFIRASGDVFSFGDTGGSTTTGGHSLSIAELPPHTHTVNRAITNNSGRDDSDNGPAVFADLQGAIAGNAEFGGQFAQGLPHTHSGVEPPFRVLNFIMKA